MSKKVQEVALYLWERIPSSKHVQCRGWAEEIIALIEQSNEVPQVCPYCDGEGNGPGCPCGFCKNGVPLDPWKK